MNEFTKSHVLTSEEMRTFTTLCEGCGLTLPLNPTSKKLMLEGSTDDEQKVCDHSGYSQFGLPADVMRRVRASSAWKAVYPDGKDGR